MTNKIREMIEKLEADENRAEGSEKLIQMLKQKEFELGENIPEEVATEVIKKCMLAHLAEKSGNPPEEKELSEEEIMHRDHVIAAVKEHFDEKGMLYSTLNVSEGNECFELGVRFRGGNFRARVLIEAKLGITCTNPQVTEGNPVYFRICFLDPFQGTVLANFAYENGARKAYCLSKLGDDYLYYILYRKFCNIFAES